MTIFESPANSSSFQKFIKESFTYSLTKIIPGLLGFLAIIIFLRYLGTEEYGLYSLLLILIQMSSFFCFGWLRQALLRSYSLLVEKPVFTGIILSGLVIAVILNGCILYLFKIAQFPTAFSFIPVVFLAISMGLVSLSEVLFMAQENPGKVVQLTTLLALLNILIPFLMIFLYQASFINIIIGLAVSYSITALIFLFIQFTKENSVMKLILPTKSHFSQLQPLFQFGWPLSLWYVSSLALRFLDRYFIEYFLDTSLMGSYAGLSEIIMKFLSILVFPITLAAHPKIMNLWNEGKFHNALYYLRMAIGTQCIIFILMTVIFLLFKSELFHVIFKLFPDLNPEIISISFPLFLGGFLWQIALLIQKPLEIRKMSILMLIFILLALGINIIGNTVFLPKYGVSATAWTLVATGIVYILLNISASFKFVLNQLK
jgi:O-antigen/teichoic acid export membrane protein|tara:strand:- start:4797 stop:6086 length:1290 start_codon:yes stop_codon:yes gene_type:complete